MPTVTLPDAVSILGELIAPDEWDIYPAIEDLFATHNITGHVLPLEEVLDYSDDMTDDLKGRVDAVYYNVLDDILQGYGIVRNPNVMENVADLYKLVCAIYDATLPDNADVLTEINATEQPIEAFIDILCQISDYKPYKLMEWLLDVDGLFVKRLLEGEDMDKDLPDVEYPRLLNRLVGVIGDGKSGIVSTYVGKVGMLPISLETAISVLGDKLVELTYPKTIAKEWLALWVATTTNNTDSYQPVLDAIEGLHPADVAYKVNAILTQNIKHMLQSSNTEAQ